MQCTAGLRKFTGTCAAASAKYATVLLVLLLVRAARIDKAGDATHCPTIVIEEHSTPVVEFYLLAEGIGP